MTIYDETSGQFRPRAPLWRLAVTSLCQFVIAAFVANALAMSYEAWMFVDAGVTPVVVEVTPWSTSFTRLAVRTSYSNELFSLRAAVAEDQRRARGARPVQDAHMGHNGIAVAALLAAACIALWLWPVEPTFRRRLFVHVMAQMLIVAAWFLVPHEPLYVTGFWYEMPRSAMLAGVLALTIPPLLIVIERRAISLLGNVYAMNRVRVRLTIWLARVAVPVALLGAAAYFSAPDRTIALWAYGILLVATFLAALPRPRERFEQFSDPELHRGFGARLVFATILVVASLAVFGIKEKRAVTITAREVKLQPWDELNFAERPRDRETGRPDRRQ